MAEKNAITYPPGYFGRYPNKPTQNSLIERFNRTFGQDVTDSHIFENLSQVRKYANAWIWMYNNDWNSLILVVAS